MLDKETLEKLQKITVLYVEDDENIRDELVDILEMDIGTLYVACDGQEGLDMFKEHKPDIVVTDIQMPNMDGLEMSSKIRELDSEVPIIITTAFNEPSFLIKAIDIGVDKYVTKPIDLDKLESTILRSAKTVFQQRIINEQIELSTLAMDRNNEMMFVTGKDFSYVNKALLNFLGFSTIEEFEKSGVCICEHLKDSDDEYICKTKKDWIEFMQNNQEKDHIVYLKRCSVEEQEAIVLPYKVELKYFKELAQYLVIFKTI